MTAAQLRSWHWHQHVHYRRLADLAELRNGNLCLNQARDMQKMHMDAVLCLDALIAGETT